MSKYKSSGFQIFAEWIEPVKEEPKEEAQRLEPKTELKKQFILKSKKTAKVKDKRKVEKVGC